MKNILLPLLFVFSSFAFARYESKWIPMKSYEFNKVDNKVLDAVKVWALSQYNTNNEKYDFEYSIRKIDAGFKAEVTPLYLDKEGQYLYMVDGEMCLELDSRINIVQAYQCAFPPPSAK